MTTKVLSIAGVDPSGGAGLLADVKTFSALQGYGMGIVTALTAQSTLGVAGVVPTDADFVLQQWLTLADDVLPDAIKIGMLATGEVAEVVGDIIDDFRARGGEHVVLDPVMVATSGDRLLDAAAEDAVKALVGRASIITPNLPEAAVLLGRPEVTEVERMSDQAEALLDLGAQRVLLKGGHIRGDEAVDIYADEHDILELAGRFVDTSNTHGTGCTLSSALAVMRPARAGWLETSHDAKRWLTHALEAGDVLEVGQGSGPVHHFWDLWAKW